MTLHEKTGKAGQRAMLNRMLPARQALEEFGFEPIMTAIAQVAASVFGRVNPPLSCCGCDRVWTKTWSPGGFVAVEILSGGDEFMPVGSTALAPVCDDCLVNSGRVWKRFEEKLPEFKCSLHSMSDRPGHA